MKHLVLGSVALGALVLGGCLNDSATVPSTPANATLSVNLNVHDVNNSNALHKGATIAYKKLIVTLTSTVGTDSVIRDTLVPGQNGFTSVSTADQSVAKTYSVRPLRGWTIQVKTLDLNDSVIHIGSKLADSMKVGEARPVTISLTSKYVMYVSKFTLPDSIGSSTGTFKQKLNVNRFVLVLDGVKVRDTTKAGGGYFSATPNFHTVGFDYVRADTAHTLKLYVYGDMLNWDSTKPLYGDSVNISTTDTLKTPTLTYTGPGSPSDPNGGATGGAKFDPLTIQIGKVGVVEITPVLPQNPLPKVKK